MLKLKRMDAKTGKNLKFAVAEGKRNDEPDWHIIKSAKKKETETEKEEKLRFRRKIEERRREQVRLRKEEQRNAREERLAKIKDKHGDKAYEKATNFYKQIDDDPKFGEEAHMKYIEQQSQPEQQSDYVLSDSRADMGIGSTSLSKYEETKKDANRVHDMSHTHDNYIVEHEFQKLMRNYNGT